MSLRDRLRLSQNRTRQDARHEAPLPPRLTTTDPRRFDEHHEATGPQMSDLASVGDLRDFAVQMARADATRGMYSDPLLTAHEKALAAEQRLWGLVQSLSAGMTGRMRESQRVGGYLAAVSRAAKLRLTEKLADLQKERDAHAAARDSHLAVLTGRQTDEQGADWSDPHLTVAASTRAVAELDEHETRWHRRRWLQYLGLGSADFVALYLVMQTKADFGITEQWANYALALFPVALASVATVALGHLLGVHVKSARRLSAGRVGHLLLATLMAVLLLAIQLFISAMRTAASGSSADGPERWMWMLIMVGIALMAAWIAAGHTNPHRAPMVAGHRSTLAAAEEIDLLKAAHSDLESAVVQREESAGGVPGDWDVARTALTAEWFHLVAIYRHELARQLGDPSITMALESAPLRVPTAAEAELRGAA